MRVLLSLLICFLFSSMSAIDVSVSYASFKGEKSNYIEVYLYVVGSTVDFANIDSLNSQANVEITILFKEGEDILKYDKYALTSPISKSSTDFIDLKRYQLENGTYTMEIVVTDLNNPTNKNTYTSENVIINYANDKVYLSDIQLLTSCEKSEAESSFVKNGLYMESAPFNFYNKNLDKLLFCTEIYGTHQYIKDDYMISYFIEPVSNLTKSKPVILGHKRKSPKEKEVLILPTDISQLPSGNYKLQVELRTRDKNLITSKAVLFQRSNPYLKLEDSIEEEFDIEQTFVMKLNPEELRYSLKAIAPKMNGPEVEIINMVIAEESVKHMRNKLFGYWANKNPNNPEQAYNTYMEVARAVDVKFQSGFGYGFESDRGFIFMKYGKPTNLIEVVDESDAPPYEIWFYDDFPFTGQTNVRFLFYNPTLAAGSYTLLHSTARGEINNPQWQLELYRDAPEELEGSNYRDATTVRDGMNRNAARYFNDF